MDASEWLKQGILGLIIVSIITGYLVPKPAVDDLRTLIQDTIKNYEARLIVKDQIIARQAALIEKLASKAVAIAAKRTAETIDDNGDG